MTTCVVGAGRAEVDASLHRVESLFAGTRLDAEWLVGTVDELAEKLPELEGAGASRVMLQHLDHADLEPVAAMGELARALAR
jgi:alkanesulfonate monooxygenase SsuD/methylene tetrahydromethanopterin reductase-like flavin-dependent oxidoreductase (luciferase family)